MKLHINTVGLLLFLFCILAQIGTYIWADKDWTGWGCIAFLILLFWDWEINSKEINHE